MAMVSLSLHSSDFENYRCDRNLSLGVHLQTMIKLFRAAGSDDGSDSDNDSDSNSDSAVTMKVQDPDFITFIFETHVPYHIVTNHKMTLLSLNQEQLSMPEAKYACIVRMPSITLLDICRQLSHFGDSVIISCTKDCKFSFFFTFPHAHRSVVIT